MPACRAPSGDRPMTTRPASRQIIPNTTADKPISEPTDRSMPPETITGVSASANRPISTLKRRTSKALAREAKFLPRTQKTATSATSSSARIASWVSAARGRARASGAGETGSCIVPPLARQRLRGDREQNDPALDGGVPVSLHVQERQRRPDGRQEGHPD